MIKLFQVAIVVAATFIIARPAFAQGYGEAKEAASSAALVMQKKDVRLERLKRFLTSYNSPLTKYSQDFVQIADKYNLDWKLIPAITGVESTFGKFIPYNSYNAYGWLNGAYYFSSWEESIQIVGKSLRENYLNRGADTVEKIASIYAPPSKTWAWKVRYFMEKLENFTPSSIPALELSL